jgi:hypothetical protein
MDHWTILQKELNYYGINIVSGKKCQLYNEQGNLVTQNVIKTTKQVVSEIKRQKKILLLLWQNVIKLLKEKSLDSFLACDENLINLFIFSLKDMSKFLLCFEGERYIDFNNSINNALNRDIKDFNKKQILRLPDYKISIDWTHRYIHRLMYIVKLLYFASAGQKSIIKYIIKTARGIAGPWSNLDLPMLERRWPFDDDYMFGETRDKENQRRYRKSLENYHTEGVGEGHYWREIRNEPFSWDDRATEDPYPHRSLLNK